MSDNDYMLDSEVAWNDAGDELIDQGLIDEIDTEYLKYSGKAQEAAASADKKTGGLGSKIGWAILVIIGILLIIGIISAISSGGTVSGPLAGSLGSVGASLGGSSASITASSAASSGSLGSISGNSSGGSSMTPTPTPTPPPVTPEPSFWVGKHFTMQALFGPSGGNNYLQTSTTTPFIGSWNSSAVWTAVAGDSSLPPGSLALRYVASTRPLTINSTDGTVGLGPTVASDPTIAANQQLVLIPLLSGTNMSVPVGSYIFKSLGSARYLTANTPDTVDASAIVAADATPFMLTQTA
jgi:hypothetical protein